MSLQYKLGQTTKAANALEQIVQEYELEAQDMNNGDLRDKTDRLVAMVDKLNSKMEKLEERMRTLTEAADNLQHDDEEINKFLEKMEAVVNLQQKAQEVYDVLHAYLKVSQTVTTQQRVVQTSGQQPQSEAHVTGGQSSGTLPNIKLPQFSGERWEFDNFWTLYEETVHKKNTSNIIKFTHLLSSLKGDAKAVMSKFRVSEENYEAAITFLKRKYDDPEATMRDLNAQLLKEAAKDNTVKEQRALFERLGIIIEQLTRFDENLNGNLLKDMLVKKFSPVIRKEIYRRKIQNAEEWSLKQLFDDIEEIIYLEENVRAMMGDEEKKPKDEVPTKKKDKDSGKPQEKSKKFSKFEKKCVFCSSVDHNPARCTVISQTKERKEFLSKHERCFRCLGTGHNIADCKRDWKCFNCNGDHNTAICTKTNDGKQEKKGPEGKANPKPAKQKPGTSPQNAVQAEMEGDETVQCESVTDGKKVQGTMAFLPTVKVPALNMSTGKWSEISMMIDTGANRTFISNDLMEKWNLIKLGEENLRLQTFGNLATKQPQLFEKTMIMLKTDHDTIELEVLSSENLAGRFKKATMSQEDLTFIKKKKLEVNSEVFETTAEPDIIIGCDHIEAIWSGTSVRLPSGLLLIKTTFGYTTMGRPVEKSSKVVKQMEEDESPFVFANTVQGEEEIEYLQKEDTSMSQPEEFTGTEAEEKRKNEEEAYRFFRETVEKKPEGYVVRLPFKEGLIEQLPDNYHIALRRLEAVLKTCSPEVKAQVDAVFKDQLVRLILEEVDINEETSNPICYNPIQPVLTPHKITTPCRVVVDGSAHYKNKYALNDVIHQGPVILPDNLGMLFRFRSGTWVILSDVEKAYLNVHVHPDDRDVTRILWVKDFNKPATPDNIRVFRFTRVMFEINASPFLLAATIIHHLDQHDNQDLARQMKTNLFVDNLILTTDGNLEEMMKIYRELKFIFNGMNMNLREFLSNNLIFNQQVDEADKAKGEEFKTLGVAWDHVADLIKLSCTGIVTTDLSRRMIAKIIASIYDPMGLLVPLLLSMKLFQRLLWVAEESYEWDTQLNESHEIKWKSIVEKIEGFSKQIPRHVVDKSGVNDVICFCDASGEAVAVCIYIRNKLGSNLLFGKSKVKPLKEKWTIPKLEMQALKIGTEKTKMVVQSLKDGDISVGRVVILTDSEIVLKWLRAPPGKKEIGVFVTNRLEATRKVAEEIIQSGIDIAFGHVSTNENPADLGTRGIDKDGFHQSIWWNGPQFLEGNPDAWVIRQKLFKLNPTEDEVALMNLCRKVEEDSKEAIFDLSRTNSLSKMRRIGAYVFRAIKKTSQSMQEETKHRMEKNIPELKEAVLENIPILAEEQKMAEIRILKEHQSQINLRKIKEWGHLNPQLNEDGLIICRGRLGNAESSVFALKPILVEPKTQLARMVMWEAHGKWHRSSQHTMTAVRETFWIPGLRQQVKQMIGKCVRCQRYNRAPFKYPDMTDMPEYRVQRSKPFDYTGIDYFGPMDYRLEDGRTSSCWGCVFSCATTRLIHNELVTDMTTKSFLNAVRRFVSEKSKPIKIVSDNAPQFLLGHNILDEISDRATSEGGLDLEIREFMGNSKIEWSFITPYAPWQGGMYERMMRSIKQAIFKGIGKNILLFDDLHTVMKEVAGMLNSRPLTYVGEELESGKVIRPIDFVYQKLDLNLPFHVTSDMTNDYIPPEEVNITKEATIEALQSAAKIVETIWQIWSTTYMAELRESHKIRMNNKRGISEMPFVGQVVLVCDPNLPKNFWKMGNVVELKYSTDGILREVHLITGTGRVIRRPINLVTPLEIEDVKAESEQLEKEQLATKEEEVSKQTEEPVTKEKRYNLRNKPRVDYNEETEEARSFCINASGGWTYLSTVISMTMLIGIFSPVGAAASIVECTATGMRINQRYDSFELCVKDYCTSRPRMAWNTGDSTDVWIPPAIKTAPHHCTAKILAQEELKVYEQDCPAVLRCENIDCTFCWSNLANPECHPTYAIVGVGVMLYCLMMMAYCIFQVPVTLGGPLALFWNILKKIAKGVRFIGGTLFQQRRRRRQFNWELVIPIIFITNMCVEGCQEIDSLTQSQRQCTKENGKTTCKLIMKDFINLNSYKREGCIRIEKNGMVTREVRIAFKSVQLECIKSTVSFSKDVEVKVWSSKRCAHTGSCQDDKCMNVTTSSIIPELGAANMFVGNTHCTESCGGPGCGCFYPSSGCLFYRIYAQPRSNDSYEIYRCSEWTEKVVMEISISELIGKNPRMEKQELVVPLNLPSTVGDVTITIDDIHKPESPLLGTWFIQNSQDEIASWEAHTPSTLYCPKRDSKDMECTLDENCNCQPAENVIRCECKDTDIPKLFKTISRRLPIQEAHWKLIPTNGSIRAVIEDAVTTEMALTIRDDVKTSILINVDQCHIEPGHLVGCYNCGTGGVAEVLCTSRKGNTVANIVCSQDMFSVPCIPEGIRHNLTFFSDSAKFRRQCRVSCGGTHSEHFEITGILKFTGSIWTSLYRVIEGKSSVFSEIAWPDVRHLFTSYFSFMKSMMFTIMIAVGAFLATGAMVASFILLGARRSFAFIWFIIGIPFFGIRMGYFFCRRRCCPARRKSEKQMA